jgi:conjugative transfer signal peptidase TraF
MTRRSESGGLLPLFAWGEELRRQKIQAHRKRRLVLATGGLVFMTLASAVLRPAPLFVWNASASAPLGLYGIDIGAEPMRGDMVIARVPVDMRMLAASRRYIPADVPLVKHVAAVPGDTVCASGIRVTIDGKAAAIRRALDGMGRVLPWWSGCHLLRQGDIFLLSPAVPASFDGRYFGVSSRSDVIGVARPLWTR